MLENRHKHAHGFTFLATSLTLAFGGCGTPPVISSNSFSTPGSPGGQASWMLPAAKRSDLLYVSDSSSKVYVYTYPGGKQVGVLSGLNAPAGECADSAGNVWVTEYSSNQIVEYSHGATKPVATLNGPSLPAACSVDPTTGDLAVAGTDLAIYQGAMGTPALYASSAFPYFGYCAYDSAGNLFADNPTTSGELAELPAGGSAIETISLNESFSAQSMQWDGSAVSIVGSGADPLYHSTHGPIDVYRVSVSGSYGTVIGKVQLGPKHTRLAVQYWINGDTIIGPDTYKQQRTLSILTWKYPAGGVPIRAIRTDWREPWGTTLSIASKR